LTGLIENKSRPRSIRCAGSGHVYISAPMPIVYTVDHARRIILAEGRGVFTPEDVEQYQTETQRPELAGYDEMVDMTAVREIALRSTDGIRELARHSAALDDGAAPSRFAIVAPQDAFFGIGRMYETYRSLDERSRKRVSVFRSRKEALAFLGIDDG